MTKLKFVPLYDIRRGLENFYIFIVHERDEYIYMIDLNLITL